MKMKLIRLLDEVKGDGSLIFYRKIPDVPVHVMIGDGVTNVFIRFTFQKEYKLPVLSCKGISSKSDHFTFTLLSSYRENDLLLSLAADLLQPNNLVLFENYQEENYVAWMRNQLLRWVSYYRNISEEVMSRERQLGLIGELQILKSYLQDGYQLSCWRGPFGDPHDFHCVNHHREVKSRLVSSKEHIKINGAEQLHHDGELLLTVLHYLDHNHGYSLYDLIDHITPLLQVNDLNEFYDLLSYVGELPAEDKTFRFMLAAEETYSINNGFPRLPIMDGISNASYCLSLNSIIGFLVKRIENKTNAS
jgi:hypothetical protein